MSDELFSPDDLPDEATIARFAERLEVYAQSLSERERDVLLAMIVRAMDPIERLRWRDTSGLLSPREDAMLRAIAGEAAEG